MSSFKKRIHFAIILTSLLFSLFVLNDSLPAQKEKSLTEKRKKELVVSTWFANRHTFYIVAKGYPKKDAIGKKKRITAMEAALLHAQFYSQNMFNKSVDVIKQGRATKYKYNGNYAVVYYRIYKPNLRWYRK